MDLMAFRHRGLFQQPVRVKGQRLFRNKFRVLREACDRCFCSFRDREVSCFRHGLRAGACDIGSDNIAAGIGRCGPRLSCVVFREAIFVKEH